MSNCGGHKSILERVVRLEPGEMKNDDTAWENACKKTAGLVEADGEAERIFHDLRRMGLHNLIRAGVRARRDDDIRPQNAGCLRPHYIVSESDLREADPRRGLSRKFSEVLRLRLSTLFSMVRMRGLEPPRSCPH